MASKNQQAAKLSHSPNTIKEEEEEEEVTEEERNRRAAAAVEVMKEEEDKGGGGGGGGRDYDVMEEKLSRASDTLLGADIVGKYRIFSN